MFKILGVGLSVFALIGIGAVAGALSLAAAGETQITQVGTEDADRRAADDAEFDAQRARDDDEQEIRNAREQFQRGLQTQREKSERAGRAVESEQRRAQRKTRLKALIEN